MVARGWSEGEWEVTANGHQVFFRILYTFKRVNFLVCELYLIFFKRLESNCPPLTALRAQVGYALPGPQAPRP